MNLKKLQIELDSLGVDKRLYSLAGGMPNERYCIDKEHGKWLVYYSERGSRTGIKFFKTECKACKYMLEELKGDATIFK